MPASFYSTVRWAPFLAQEEELGLVSCLRLLAEPDTRASVSVGGEEDHTPRFQRNFQALEVGGEDAAFPTFKP